jgi:hypothetical protein
MDAHQRRVKRRQILRGDGIDKFIEWMKGAAAPCVYMLHPGARSGGNQSYWAAVAGVPASKFTRETVLRLLGCGVQAQKGPSQ